LQAQGHQARVVPVDQAWVAPGRVGQAAAAHRFGGNLQLFTDLFYIQKREKAPVWVPFAISG
jgi:hypothetical protein